MIKSIIYFICAVFILPIATYGDPSISSVSDSTPTDGQSITINGTGFGTNSSPTPLSWFGGSSGNIESGTVGVEFSATNWATLTAGGSEVPEYSDTKSHSYDQAISAYFYGAQWDNGFRYHKSDMTELYVTAWFKLDRTDASTDYQLKMYRIKELSSHDVQSNDSGLLITPWRNGGAIASYTKTNDSDKIYHVDDRSWTRYWGWNEWRGIENNWRRMNFYGKRNSDDDEYDGIVRYSMYGIRDSFKSTTVCSHITSNDDWNYMILATFYGSLDTGITKDATLYTDDIYVATSPARVELCNFDTWADRFDSTSECDVQPLTSWSSTQIGITVNTAGNTSSPTEKWLYVVDSDENANSSGYSVTASNSVSGADPVGTITTPASCPATVETATTTVAGGATDSDGTIASVGWENLTTSASGSCTAVDGTFDEDDDPYTCSSLSLQVGSNSIRITVTDNDSNTDTVDCAITYDTGGDITPPTITLTSHEEDSVNESGTFLVTVAGTLSDETATDRVEVSCPDCDAVSAVTGVDTWSVNLTLSISGLGADQLQADGTFATSTGWYIGSGCTITGGQLVCSGGSGYWTITADAQATLGTSLRTNYEVVSYTSGDLIESQYGFAGLDNYTYLSTSVGTHYKDTFVVEENDLVLTFYNFVGTLDNISVQPIGSSNVATITGYDTSDNSDSVVVTFVYESQNPIAIQVSEGSDLTISSGSGLTWSVAPTE